MKLIKFLKHIGNDNRGATAVEYGLILSLVVIAIVAALQSVATANTDMWAKVETETTKVWGS